MSIKKLFGETVGDLQSADYKNQKETFEPIESARNAEAIELKQNTFVPQVDFAEPENFAKYGSAYLYYSGAMNRILDFYPYDGSKAEKNEFYNGLMGVEKYVFDNLYPKSTGYAVLSPAGYTRVGDMTSDGYGTPSSYEYITFKGGPGTGSAGSTLVSKSPNAYSNKFNYSNIYDTDIYTTENLPSDYGKGTRQSNLKANFDTGVTVEFWLKKEAFDVTATQQEVVFDLWNSASVGNTDYGRLTITIQGSSGSATPFLLTAQSGTVSASFVTQSIGSGLTPSSLTSWGHYAFVFQNSGSMLKTQLYVNGYINDVTSSFSTPGTTNGSLGEITGSMIGRIGALITNPMTNRVSASSARNGDGRLSASLDEFRYWKVARNAQQIGESFFVPVGGGVNTDISNTTLGVYYKFNEGITTVAATDSIVLDYAGRVTNGAWTGYTSTSRNTGSAIVSASAASREDPDPIMRSQHTDVSTLQTNLLESGSFYDSNNNSSFINYAPAWVIEEHENEGNDNLKIISHIMGAYFDKMYLLTSQMPALRQTTYTTASHRPYPFAHHLPQSLGLYSPEIFVDSTILEKFESRTEKELFESKLVDAKNLIYLNLYNNLTNIYKSKGTEKSIRNVMRCFNLDDSLLKLKVYNRDNTYQLKNNLQQSMLDRSSLDFNQSGNIHAVVYQALTGTATPVSRGGQALGYISASRGTAGAYNAEARYGATIEASLTLPKFFSTNDKFNRTWISSSLFGLYQVTTGSITNESGSATTLRASDETNFQIFAVRDAEYSKNVRFLLTSSISPHPIPTLSSSTFPGAYDDSQWNLSVRIKPRGYPLDGMVTGSTTNYPYDVIFRGVNTILGTVRNSFEVTGVMGAPTHYPAGYSAANSYLSGTNFLHSAKRVYAGARRTNLTGTVLNPSDVRFSSIKYWTKVLDNLSLDQHVYDLENAGISGSYREIAPRDTNNAGLDLTNANTIALNWRFDNLTSSNAGGYFNVTDYSSGSALLRDNYGWLGEVVGYQHGGYGWGFPPLEKAVVQKQLTNVFKFIDPEQAVSSDMIQILDKDDEVFGVVETVPDFIYTLEKSQQQAVSDEMLDFFAGVIDFNNLIGAPINRYRDRYKNLEKLREAFYRRVTAVTDVEKFVGYYKWFDDAITEIVSQLVPASSNLVEGVLNTIEPTVLDRSKYETKYPTLDAQVPDLVGVVGGEAESAWDAKLERTTVPRSPRDTTRHVPFWKTRAIRSADEISAARFVGAAAAAIIDAQRETFRKVIVSAPHMSRSAPTFYDHKTNNTYTGNAFKINTLSKLFKVTADKKYDTRGSIKGGVNFDANKNIHFTYAALHPAGPVDQSGGRFVPQNVLIAFMKDLVALPYDNDPKLPIEKIKRYITVNHGRAKVGESDEHLKSSLVFPFNLISSSVKTGYQKEVYDRLTASFEITNLHNDVYGPDMEKPLQGPFTEHVVGGHQSRHVRVNYSSSTHPLDTWRTRPEAWKILLGTCDATFTGAIGMVGADYPWPEWNGYPDVPGNYPAYPMTAALKAVYYRDVVAKRPVNIKNIKLTTGSTILGNYRHTYDFVNTVGTFNNPRGFIENQPTFPANVFQTHTTGATSTNTILDMPRLLRPGTVPAAIQDSHFTFVGDYSTSYLTSAINKSVIVGRFSNHGGPEVQSRGHQDFRSSEYSVYNALNFKNLTVIKPSQGPSGTISETEGIRVSDIHGFDYGLRSQLSRHTARFGRDSLFVTSTAVPYGNAAPGGTYNQLPGFHKVHRNNVGRPKCLDTITYGYNKALTNSSGYDFGAANYLSTLILTGADNNDATNTIMPLIGAVTSSGLSWTGWINFGEQGSAVTQSVTALGLRHTDKTFFEIQKTHGSGEYKFQVYLRLQNTAGGWRTGGGAGDYNLWEFTSTDNWSSGWNHFSVVWDASAVSNGSLASVADKYMKIYYNGVDTEASRVDSNTTKNYYSTWDATKSGAFGFSTPPNNIVVTYNGAFSIGGDFTGLRPMSGAIDEYTYWTRPLTPLEVRSIYNSGTPCDITQSTAYTSDVSKLWDWIRFGTGSTNEKTDIRTANAGTYGIGNRVVGFTGTKTYLPLAVNGGTNPAFELTGGAGHASVLAGCASVITGATTTTTCTDRTIYDNFYVKHPIPRSSKQYTWVTRSLASTNGVFGYAPATFRISSSTGGTKNAYNFVSQSDFGRYYQTSAGSNRSRFGWTSASVAAGINVNKFIPVDFVGMNTIIVDQLNTSINTMGRTGSNPRIGLPAEDYINYDIINQVQNAESSASILNALTLNRQGIYGYPIWRQVRTGDNPITRWERKNNVVSMMSLTGARNAIARYNVPPVSMEGRPVTVNLTANGMSFGLDVTHNNESVYYPSVAMENQLDIQYDLYDTPFEQLIKSVKQPASPTQLNWVLYTQKLFPSSRNEFTSGSNERIKYDNRFWTSNREARNSKGAYTYQTTSPAAVEFGNNDISYNSLGIIVKQSSWPLDAPDDFMTRTRPMFWKYSSVTLPYLYRGGTGSAGELQNAYTNYFTASFKTFYPWSGQNPWTRSSRPRSYDHWMLAVVGCGALYSRKHLLSISASVVGPSGMKIPETSSRAGHAWSNAAQIWPIGGGEALWEAGTQAGVVTADYGGSAENAKLGIKGSDTSWGFNLSQSAPWKFDTYEDYRYELKLLAKDYGIVPEYRISEHVNEYLQKDPLETRQTTVDTSPDGDLPYKGTYEIVGTNKVPDDGFATFNVDVDVSASYNSLNTQNFFIDYSNTEFLQDFLKIKRETLLGATQIKMVCSAALRFNPYKGFYPAERTIDLVSQFRKSYQKSLFSITGREPDSDDIFPGGGNRDEIFYRKAGSHTRPVSARPLLSAICSPGILYNSIKSGLAVDYPLVLNGNRMMRQYYGALGSGSISSTTFNALDLHQYGAQDNYALTFNPNQYTNSDISAADSSHSKKVFWDKRLPFETMLTPAKYLNGLSVPDQEAHPSASLWNVTCSFAGDEEDDAYTLMASNFFGETAAFFLQDADYTSLKSGVLRENLRFVSGSTYMARVKINRSMTGSRSYLNEKGGIHVTNSAGASSTYAYGYGVLGARAFNHLQGVRSFITGGSVAGASAEYPLPQDPYHMPGYRESFTMYSRPTAFGPELSGRMPWSQASGSDTVYNKNTYHYPLDSFNGFNWSFTPPYYHGEAWADLIFRPNHTKSYDIQQIMAETITQYWRCDAGPAEFLNQTSKTQTLLISSSFRSPSVSGNLAVEAGSKYPSAGIAINQNAMQLSASFNLFGIEEVPFQETDAFGNLTTTRNDSVGQRWVIKPKYETPMLNFTDTGPHPIKSGSLRDDDGIKRWEDGAGEPGYLSSPPNLSASVPRGMWHQFGIIEPDPDKGIFMQIGDIPEAWLKYHWTMLNTGSVYNKYTPQLTSIGHGIPGEAGMMNDYTKIKSLTSLVGFDKGKPRKRLGQLAKSRTIREAIVAVPYITETVDAQDIGATTAATANRKKFIEISPERLRAAKDDRIGSAEGDSLITAGESIRKQLQKMKRYVLPPEMDFLNNESLPAIAMYIFEFEYTFDKDDLNYMWQNLAPRDSQKISFQSQSVAHELINTELLSETELAENQNLRWMVFKVKQKAQADYYDLTLPQVGEAQILGVGGTTVPTGNKGQIKTKSGSVVKYNWPYDYVSLIELIKIDAQILYSEPRTISRDTIGTSGVLASTAPQDFGSMVNDLVTAPGYRGSTSTPSPVLRGVLGAASPQITSVSRATSIQPIAPTRVASRRSMKFKGGY